ncbi:MAG TPA: hypothetical protein DEA08_08390 [Planctomycetes bacterium]|nr:hypothetical protein [Planctomycetota bacterium]
MEKDEGLRAALSQQLTQRGYRVVAACSREEGFDLLDELDPQILLLDDPAQEGAYRLVWLTEDLPDTRVELVDLQPKELSRQLEALFDDGRTSA